MLPARGIRRNRRNRLLSDRISTLLLISFCILFPLLFCALPVRAHGFNSDPKPISPVVGIDLGTTNSCVAVQRDGRVEIIPNEYGDRTTPSYVAFTENGQRLVGMAAKNRSTIDARNTIYDIKRVIGLPFHDRTVQESKHKHFPFKLTSRNAKTVVEVGNPESPDLLSPEQISATILSQLKSDAEKYLGVPVTQAVISVPAWFNDAQRAATKDAGRIAGLDVLRLINEPTAAALAYGLETEKPFGEHLFVVYDLGGGTFDVSVVEQDDGIFEVLATGGDTHLGGEDFDNRIIDRFAARWNALHPDHDVTKDNAARARLRDEVERAKRALSEPNTASTMIQIPKFINRKDFSAVLTRAEFDKINDDLFQQTLRTLTAVIKDSKRDKTEIEDVILIGGSTRLPRIRELLQNYFPGKTLRTDINPDEAVAIGAAKMASILMGDEDSLVGLFDVNSLSLGVDANGLMVPIIIRNTIIPTKRSKLFTTTKDGQESVTIRVLEGERARVAENNYLGQLTLSGITPAPRGVPEIEVTFQLDQNGMLQVTAMDKATGQSTAAAITNQESRLSYEEIERILEDAEKYAEKDQQFRERTEALSNLESQAHMIRRFLNTIRSDKTDYEALESTVQHIIKWMESEDLRTATTDQIKDKTKTLLAEYAYHKNNLEKKHAHIEL